MQNNHHFRIAPFERRVPWSVAQEHYPVSYEDEYNLLPRARKHELSHHLAHLWSVLPQAPFSEGLVVVMDGMGELYSAMARALRSDTHIHGQAQPPASPADSPERHDVVWGAARATRTTRTTC